MQIYRTLDEAAAGRFVHPVATIGVFDGVHVGHRYVLRECLSLASKHAGEVAVVTFVHHPRAIIAGKAPKLITSIEHRLRLFEELGVHHCIALEFDDALRSISAMDFAQRVFVEILGAEVVVIGHNGRFGRDREGGADFLMEHGDVFPFETRHASEVRIGDRILSSTNIREAILEGDLEGASRMLGRPFAVYGTVVPGDARGRTIGFPTANLDLHHELRPPRGVYGVRVALDGRAWFGLANIGVRPTFEETAPRELLEVHLLDFSGDLYGRDLEVTFLVRLRGEQRFDGVEALKVQIAADREAFEAHLGSEARPEFPAPRET